MYFFGFGSSSSKDKQDKVEQKEEEEWQTTATWEDVELNQEECRILLKALGDADDIHGSADDIRGASLLYLRVVNHMKKHDCLGTPEVREIEIEDAEVASAPETSVQTLASTTEREPARRRTRKRKRRRKR